MSPHIATTPEALDIPGATTAPKTPAHERNRRDVFSGLPSMKEVFDVSYAVHRMAEERSRRKEIRRRQHQQQASSNLRSDAAYSNMMGNIDDDEDDDDYNNDEDDDDNQENIAPPPNVPSHGEPTSLLQKMQRDKITQQMDKPAVSTKRSSAHKSAKSKPIFELNMDKATLIGRRRHQKEEENNEQ